MKTSIQSLFATGLIALAFSTSAVYANDALTTKIVNAKSVDITAIQKVYVSGNVDVTLVQAPKSKTLFTKENNADVYVKTVGNALYIDAKNNTETAKITVYIDDIYRISAAGNAIIETQGVLTLKNLQVFLKDKAVAEINSKTESLYTVVDGEAELKLKGFSNAHAMVMDKLAKVTLEKFDAVKTDVSNSKSSK